MARRCNWEVVTGYEDHAPSLRLVADGGFLSEADCTRLAFLLLLHVDRLKGHRKAKTAERKQHEADIAFEEAEAKRGGSHRKVR